MFGFGWDVYVFVGRTEDIDAIWDAGFTSVNLSD